MNKLSIVVGHNPVQQGAVMPWKSNGPTGVVFPISEYNFYRNEVVPQLLRWGHEFSEIDSTKVFYREFVGKRQYGEEMRRVYAKVNDWDPVANVELHFNSASPSATGTETFCSGSTKGTQLAECLQDSITSSLGLFSRGVKTRSRKENGGASLWNPKAPSALIEPFFGTNQGDREALAALGASEFSKSILRGVSKYFQK